MLGSSDAGRPIDHDLRLRLEQRVGAVELGAQPRDLVVRRRFQSRRARARAHQHDGGDDGKQHDADEQHEHRDLVAGRCCAMRQARVRAATAPAVRRRRAGNGAMAPMAARNPPIPACTADAHSPGSSGSCPACPFASAGCRSLASPLPSPVCWRRKGRGRARESHDFTLKRNRAERVQIVNEAWLPLGLAGHRGSACSEPAHRAPCLPN